MSTTPINIAYPESGELQLKLALGACKLDGRTRRGRRVGAWHIR